MAFNEGAWDRVVRTLAGIPLVVIGWFLAGTVGIVLAALGLVLLATAAVGWCPLYTVFGINTLQAASRS